MIFNYFKEEFGLHLKKGIFPNYQDLLKKSLFEYNMTLEEIDEAQFKLWFENICHLEFLKEHLFNAKVNEIIIHSNKLIQIEVDGNLKDLDLNIKEEYYQLSLEYLALVNNQVWNYTNPFVSFQMTIENQVFRVSMTHHSISPIENPKVFMRRIRSHFFKLSDFKVPEKYRPFIEQSIVEKKNIIVAGATGSGKTSLMKSLLNFIPKSEHVITLEDTYELTNLPENWTSLLADDKKKGFSLSELCSYSLRMRPDRIILGEVRSKEAIPFLMSMNNGHKGLMGTIHANSGQDTLHRLALLFSLYSENGQIPFNTIMDLICKNLDYVIYVKNKEIIEIIEVLGSQENGIPLINEIYSQQASPSLQLLDHEYFASSSH